MFLCRRIVLVGLASVVLSSVFAGNDGSQKAFAAFLNLGFESATVIPAHIQISQLPAAEALPYWTGNNYVSNCVVYDTTPLDSVGVCLEDAANPYGGWKFMYPIEGNYSLWLNNQTYVVGNPDTFPCAAWISQTATVPSYARSLMFASDCNGQLLTVSLNGTVVPARLYSRGSLDANNREIDTYIADVTTFANQSAALQFTCGYGVPAPNGFVGGNASLDSVRFSSTIVAEPSTIALALVAGAGLLARRRWRLVRS
jgi:hypothetical protein